MKRKDTLIAKRAKLTAAIQEIELREQIAKNKQLVGKFLMYPRNCYSCPEKPEDYWNVYYAITSIDADGFLYGVKFQTDKDGKCEIQTEAVLFPDSLTEITQDEFWDALTKFENSVAQFIRIADGNTGEDQ